MTKVQEPSDKEQVAQAQFEEMLKKRMSDPLDDKATRRTLDGTLVYGPPMNKKRKAAIKWVKETMDKEKVEVKSEVFVQLCPFNWIFVYSQTRGWFKVYVGDFLK